MTELCLFALQVTMSAANIQRFSTVLRLGKSIGAIQAANFTSFSAPDSLRHLQLSQLRACSDADEFERTFARLPPFHILQPAWPSVEDTAAANEASDTRKQPTSSLVPTDF